MTTIARLIAATKAAVEILQEDRSALFDASVNRRSGEVDDPASASIIATYDAVIAEAKAAAESIQEVA